MSFAEWIAFFSEDEELNRQIEGPITEEVAEMYHELYGMSFDEFEALPREQQDAVLRDAAPKIAAVMNGKLS